MKTRRKDGVRARDTEENPKKVLKKLLKKP